MQLFAHVNTKKTIGIIVALSISGLLITGSYIASTPGFSLIPKADAEDTKKLLEAYAAKDSDGDGLPDWEEALYGTNPQDPHSVDPILTDSQAVAEGKIKPKFESAPIATSTTEVPGVAAASNTLTDQFAKVLFQQYIQSTGSTAATPDQVASFVSGAMGQLGSMYALPKNFTGNDVHVQGSGSAALATYAQSADTAFFSHLLKDPKDETDYFYAAVTNNDDASLQKVAAIGTWYTQTANTYVKISVPQEMLSAHLAVSNALLQLGTVVSDMALVNTDPLRAMLALDHYDAARQALIDALAQTHSVFVSGQISAETTPAAARFLNMAENWSAAATK